MLIQGDESLIISHDSATYQYWLIIKNCLTIYRSFCTLDLFGNISGASRTYLQINFTKLFCYPYLLVIKIELNCYCSILGSYALIKNRLRNRWRITVITKVIIHYQSQHNSRGPFVSSTSLSIRFDWTI